MNDKVTRFVSEYMDQIVFFLYGYAKFMSTGQHIIKSGKFTCTIDNDDVDYSEYLLIEISIKNDEYSVYSCINSDMRGCVEININDATKQCLINKISKIVQKNINSMVYVTNELISVDMEVPKYLTYIKKGCLQ